MTITRQQIESMPAGSEMDAMVARRVMKWSETQIGCHAHSGWFAISPYTGNVVRRGESEGVNREWCPSTKNDESSQDVINAVMQKHGAFDSTTLFEGGACGVIIAGCAAKGDSLGEAVCRAALLAELERMNP